MNKVGDEKCKERPLSPFKWRHFYLLGKNRRKKFFFQKIKVAGITCCDGQRANCCRKKKQPKLEDLVPVTISSCKKNFPTAFSFPLK